MSAETTVSVPPTVLAEPLPQAAITDVEWPGRGVTRHLMDDLSLPYSARGATIRCVETGAWREIDVGRFRDELATAHEAARRASPAATGRDRIVLFHPFPGDDAPATGPLRSLLEATAEVVNARWRSRLGERHHVIQIVWLPERFFTQDAPAFFSEDWFSGLFPDDRHSVFLFSDRDRSGQRISPGASRDSILRLASLLVGHDDVSDLFDRWRVEAEGRGPEFFAVGTQAASVPIHRLRSFVRNRILERVLNAATRSIAGPAEQKALAQHKDAMKKEFDGIGRGVPGMEADFLIPAERIDEAFGVADRRRVRWSTTADTIGRDVPEVDVRSGYRALCDTADENLTRLNRTLEEQPARLRRSLREVLENWKSETSDREELQRSRGRDWRQRIVSWLAVEDALDQLVSQRERGLDEELLVDQVGESGRIRTEVEFADHLTDSYRQARDTIAATLGRLVRPLPLLAAAGAIVVCLAFVVEPGVFVFVAERMEETGLWLLDHLVPRGLRADDWYRTVGPGGRVVARAAGLGLAPLAALLLAAAGTAAVLGRRSAVRRAVRHHDESLRSLRDEASTRLNGGLGFRRRAWQIRLVTTELQFYRDRLRRVKSVRPRLHQIVSDLEARALRIGYQATARGDGVRAAPLTPPLPPLAGVASDWFARADAAVASELTAAAPSSGTLVPLARTVEQTLTEAVADVLTAHEPSTTVWSTLARSLDAAVGEEWNESVDAIVRQAVTETLARHDSDTPAEDGHRSLVPIPIGPGTELHEVHLPAGLTVDGLDVEALLRRSSVASGRADVLAETWTGVFEPAAYRLEVRVFADARSVFGGSR